MHPSPSCAFCSMLVGCHQHPSSPRPPKGRSSVPPWCCPDCSVLTPEPQAWLTCSSFSRPRPEGMFPFLPHSPVSPGSISELFPLAEGQPKPAAAHQLSCRREGLGWVLLVSHSTAALEAGVGGPGAPYFDFQDNSALLGSQHGCALACRTPSGRWALVRKVLQAPRDLLLNLVCPSAAQLRAKGTPAVGLHTGISLALVLYPSCSSGLSIPTPAQPSPAMVEAEAVTLTPGCLCSAWLQHQLRRAEGILLPKGVSWYQGLLPRNIPVPCTPGLCLGEPWSSWQQRAEDTTGPPAWAHVFPNHLNLAAFEQTL